MSYLEQFLEFLASPYGLVGLCLSAFVWVHARPAYRRLHWFLLSLFGFAASLKEMQNRWIEDAPALVFPLEQLRDAGRPLSIFLLGLLLLVALRTRKGWRSDTLPTPVLYLIVVQLLVFFKTLQSGSLTFAIISFVTFGAIIFMMAQGPSQWLQNQRNFELGIWSIATVGIIFIVANLYQASKDLHAIMFVHGLLTGTTGNPQHAAVLLMATIPCFLFLIQKPNQIKLLRWFWIACLAMTVFGLTLTGSRTGGLSAIVAVILFYRYQWDKFVRLGLGVAVVLAAIWLFAPNAQLPVEGFSIDSPLSELGSLRNTRTGVWQGQWRTFMEHPWFGAPLTGSRLGYGENSWLAAGASLGLLGFIPIVLFGIESIKNLIRLDRIAVKQPSLYVHCSVVIAGIGGLLVGSFAEGYLLGNLTFSLIALLLYQFLGTYLLDLEKRTRKLQQEGTMPITRSSTI